MNLRTALILLITLSIANLSGCSRKNSRTQALEDRIQYLEQRLAESNPSSSQTNYTPDNKWHIKGNWRKLKDNMSMSQVKNILGPPTSTNTLYLTTWKYEGYVSGYGDLIGVVRFDNNGQLMKFGTESLAFVR